MTRSALLLVVLQLATSCTRPPRTAEAPAPATPPPPSGTHAKARDPVGVAARTFEDTARERRLVTTIWYPAAAGTAEDDIWWDGIFAGRGAWDAPLRPMPHRVPLVLLSHGSGGDGSNLAWLAEALATHGWIAAAVDHRGDRFGDTSADGRIALWRRVRDVSFVLSRLLDDPVLGDRIDRTRIAAVGHSSGGATVLALAGARFRPAAFLGYCHARPPGPDCAFVGDLALADIPDLPASAAPSRDRRVRAVVALAPALGPGFADASLVHIAVPVAIVASPTDELVPFDRNAARFARLIPHARLMTVPGAGHFVYTPVCSRAGRLLVAEVCVDPTPDVDRAAVHGRVATFALAFLERALRPGPAMDLD